MSGIEGEQEPKSVNMEQTSRKLGQYVCDVCQYSFETREELEQHKKLHV
ncbi:MAG TPA: C2H2-type zinc finger protein [Nitrososphaera sp.]|jgi:hypothetical protein